MTDVSLSIVGARLRDAGLTARALAAWCGTARLSAVPARLDAMPAAEAITPAGAILGVFVAGATVDRARVRGLGDDAIDALLDHSLVAREGDAVRATAAILPLGSPEALVVCDRLDAPIAHDLVCWPDDSSYHLASALPPGRRADWLDLGCGSAFAALARPELAAQITGVDLNPRAVRFARLGAALSGVTHLAVTANDIGAPHAPAALVTCNAPIPDPAQEPAGMGGPYRTAWQAALELEIWRRAEPGFFARMWPALRQAVRPGGLIVVHAARAAILPALADADGERAIVTYTPDGVRGFAVAWWRPDAPARFADVHRALTADRPHLTGRDRDDALAP
jgi:SAM-dependent methyltransferase